MMNGNLLNQDSTHPRPFRAWTGIEKFFQVRDRHQIYQGWRQNWTPNPDPLTHTTTFNYRLWVAFKKSMAFGAGITWLDMHANVVARTPKEFATRFVYIGVPWAAMATSFIAWREVLMNFAESRGHDRTSMYTYTLAPLAPAVIWGSVWSPMTACVVAGYGGALMGMYYWSMSNGMKYNFMLSEDEDKAFQERTQMGNTGFGWVNHWKSNGRGKKAVDDADPGPAWKQWVDENNVPLPKKDE